MSEYKHLPIIDKWDHLKHRIDSEIDNWVKRSKEHVPDDDDYGMNMFSHEPERKEAPLYNVRLKMDELDAEERRDKWLADAICEVCDGKAAEYVMQCLQRAEQHDPDSKATPRKSESTNQEILDHTIKVIYARYMYDQETGGAK